MCSIVCSGRSGICVWQQGRPDADSDTTSQHRRHHRDSAGSGADEIHIPRKVRHLVTSLRRGK